MSVDAAAAPHASAPAPWTLHGTGFILLYRFSREFLGSHGLLDEEALASFAGGFGAVMAVDYHDSPVGPYRELLFIPGRFRTSAGKRHRITRIYVSTEASVVNGRANWAIPKELAAFGWDRSGRTDEVTVTVDGKLLFSARLRERALRFPLSTALLPFPLAQRRGDDLLLTRFSGKGWARPVAVEELRTGEGFPALDGARPLLVLKVAPFTITFPSARVVRAAVRAARPRAEAAV